MKSTALVCALTASMGFGSLAYADDNDRRSRGHEPRFEHRWHADRDGRHADRRAPRYGHYPSYTGGHAVPRAYGHAWNDRYADGPRGPQFQRGGYLPAEYRGRAYGVNDWRGHRLSAPPRGQQWVQVGTDYALIAIATGLILNIALR